MSWSTLRKSSLYFVAGVVLKDAHQDAGWRSVDELRDRAIKPLEREARLFILKMEADVLAGLRAIEEPHVMGAKAHVINLLQIVDLFSWFREIRDLLGPVIGTVMERGFEVGATRVLFDGSWNPEAEAAIRSLAESVNQIVTVPQTYFEAIDKIIVDGIDSNLSLDEIAKEIKKATWDPQTQTGLSDYQAKRIARTSGGGAFEGGQHQAYIDAGIERHSWLSRRDAKVRPSHVGLDGEEVNLGEKFSNGLRYPLDPLGSAAEIVACRCTSSPILSDE